MAITQTGSTLQFNVSDTAETGTVSSTITVPADAEIAIVGVSSYHGSSGGHAAMTLTKGGVDTSMTKATGGDVSTSQWQSAMFYLALPDTGSNKTLKWDWNGASADPGKNFSITFWKGIDTASPVRDSDGAQAGSFPVTTPSLTAQSGDLIVAFCGQFESSQDGSGEVSTWTNLTELTEIPHSSYAEGSWATGSPSGDTTVSAATGTSSEPALVAVVLRPPVTTLTVTDESSATSTSSTATLATAADVDADVGDWLVVFVAADNAGTNGAASLSSVTDGSNTYTQRALINWDPTSASTGATLGIYTAAITSALSGGTVTANFSPNTTFKAMQVYRVVPPSGFAVGFVSADTTGTTGSSSATAAATVSVNTDEVIFAGAAIESDDAFTGDSDTTNGSWSAALARIADGGTDASCMMSISQWKLATGTGNQTWSASSGATRDWAASYLILEAVSSAATVTADAGSYALTGTAASLEIGREVAAEAGSYALTGAAASLSKGITAAGDAGSYAISGTDATFDRTYVIGGAAGSYALSGTAASLEHGYEVAGESGAYSLSGTAASLEFGREVSGETGSYSIAGTDATLVVTGSGAIALSAEAGSYSLSGTAASLELGREVSAGAGSYTITGADAEIVRQFVLSAGSYTISGSDATLTYVPLDDLSLAAGAGSYAISGAAASLEHGWEMAAEAGSYTLSGTDASLAIAARLLGAEAGSYTISGADATLTAAGVVGASEHHRNSQMLAMGRWMNR